MKLRLYNTITRKLEDFIPLHESKVGMYVCGPTVYDYPHIGNARSAVIYDTLYRLLIELYGKSQVTYVRNITDVDDKINQAAKDQGVSIKQVTDKFEKIFHDDMTQLGCLPPTIEPRATKHINEMIMIITKLIENGHAYHVNNHVYFATKTFKDYGELSGRNLDELLAGVRIEVSQDKKDASDFVLWKPANISDDPSSIFNSPWGLGRPGWHIECSAMSMKYLGMDFDIHGGGADLMFPHHTNEIAQSRCFDHQSKFARYWVHNGFLTVNGEKMSKSLGNFITVRQLLDQNVKGEVIRYLLLATNYRKPLDFSEKVLADAQKAMDSFYRAANLNTTADTAPEDFIKLLCDDLNTAECIAYLHNLAGQINKTKNIEEKSALIAKLKASANLLGLLNSNYEKWFKQTSISENEILQLIEERKSAKIAKNWQKSDQIRQDLQAKGIILEDHPDGTTSWRAN